MKYIAFIVCLFFVTSPLLGEVMDVDNDSLSSSVLIKEVEHSLTGNLRYDLALLENGHFEETSLRRKLPPKIPQSIALSLILPGAGQYYNGDKKRSMAFISAEILLVGGYFAWKSRGNDGVDEYQAYAHARWSPRKYAEWLNEFSGYGGPPISLPEITDEQFQNPTGWNEDQIVAVRRFFNDIRTAEGSSFYLTTGASFSHVLPYFGEQQYYELIGKYFQYAPGWSDYTANPDEDAEVVIGNSPNSEFLFYDGIHTDANTNLRRASRMTGLIFALHFASAVEAAVSAKFKNERYKPTVSIQPNRNGGYTTLAGLSVKF